MIEYLVSVEYHPKGSKEMGEEIKNAVDYYKQEEMGKEALGHIINHYARSYGYLLFSEDYQLKKSIQNIIGKKRMKVVYQVLDPQQMQIY